MKLGLSLCGGGAYGAYEQGIYRYLHENKYKFDAITGTSIGALNAAMIATSSFEVAENLWRNITVEDVIKGGLDIDETLLENFSIKRDSKFQKLVRAYIKNGGADITPLIKLVKKTIGPMDFKHLDTKVGVVVTKYPGFAEEDILLNDLPKGKVPDYLIASASCFPAFPIYNIGKNRYADGGWKNNLPVDYCFSLGADKVIAVLLESFPTAQKQEYLSLPNVTLIRPSSVYGKMLSFKHDEIVKNMETGYLDATKILGDHKGYKYTFTSNKSLNVLADKHMSLLTRFGAKVALKNINYLFEDVTWDMPITALNVFLLNLERVMDLFEMDKFKVYGIEQASKYLFGMISTYDNNEEDEYNKEKLNLASLFWKQKEASLKSERSVLDKVFIDTFIN